LTRSLLALLGRVLVGFRENRGLLLAGAVAYYTLLSLVPLFVILLVALSHVVDRAGLLATVQSNLDLVIAGQSEVIVGQIEQLLADWETVGLVGVAALLFFSATAFAVLENAMGIIFHHRVVARRRSFLVSAILPYLFVTLVGTGLLLITVISAAMDAVEREWIQVLGYRWPLAGVPGALLYWLGVIGLLMLLTALYMVLPVGRVRFRDALVGGITATVLWELMRRALVWYFGRLSMVNLIYGSLGAVVMALLTLEVAAIILLFGAQIVAEVDRARRRSPAARR
jgi:membrane protein